MAVSNVKKNSLYNLLKTMSGIIFPLITFPYISRVLEPENIGKINFGNSIISYFSLFAMLGVQPYAVRLCSEVSTNKEELNKSVNEILSLNIITTCISYSVLLILLFFSKSLVNYRLLIGFQSLSIIFTVLGGDWLNTAMEDFKYITIRTIAFQILSLILMFIFVREKEDYIIYVIINIIAVSGANVVNIFYRRKYCNFRFTIKLNLRKHYKPVLYMFALCLAQIIYVNSDMTILGIIKGDEQVGLYSASVKIYTIVNTCVSSIAIVLLPKLSRSFNEKNYTEINKLLKYGIGFIIVLGFPCITGINILSKEILFLLGGEKFILADTSLHLLSVSLLFSFLGGFVSNMILIPLKKESIYLRNCFISAFVNIILNFIFIPKFGLNAAAATTAVSEFIGFVLSIFFIPKEIRISGILRLSLSSIFGCILIFVLCFFIKKLNLNFQCKFLVMFIGSVIVYLFSEIILKNEFLFSFYEGYMKRIKEDM